MKTTEMGTKMKLNCLAAGLFLAGLTPGLSQPIVTQHPSNQSASLGANLIFEVRASGSLPLAYQWRLGTMDILNATNRTLGLTNVHLTNAGDYTVVVTNSSGSVTSRVAHLEVDPTFTVVTAGNIVTDFVCGLGTAWGDYDGDGFLDLFVSCASNNQNGTAQRNLLYHNNRDGTFTRITNSVLTSEARDWRGCSWADYDNDGSLDLFVTSTDANGFSTQNELFRNNGDGTFKKMTAREAGAIVPGGGGSEGCIWADYDNDGFLDLYVVRYGTDWLFRNIGDGTYITVASEVGIPPDNRTSYRGMWGDYDNDGRADLFVVVEPENGVNQTSCLYHNNGNGTFVRILDGSIATDKAPSHGCAWADYDNDGNLDLLVVNGFSVAGTNALYRNNGNGTFTKMTNSVATDVAQFGSGIWGDYDNDGWLDLFVTELGDGTKPVNYLYHNNGDGSFSRVRSGSPVNDLSLGGGCAWGDYDNDGFLDLFLTRGGSHFPALNGLFRNNGNSNGWLKVKLVGMVSNRSAIGAKVRVQAAIGGRRFWQMREINTGSGFGGALEAHFGLGDAAHVETLRIEWPSGIVQEFQTVGTNQFLTVAEHQEPGLSSPIHITSVSRSTNGVVDLSATGETGLHYLFEASTDLVNWTKVGVRSNAVGIVGFTDTKATNYASRFYRVSIP